MEISAFPLLRVGVFVSLTLAAACSGRTSPEETLIRAQRAVDGSRGYRVMVTGHNLVLPAWGGIDAGTLQIGIGPSVAQGELERTGDGRYSLAFVDGQTYFQRSTCGHPSRVSGGGADTLRPFLWAGTSTLAHASNPRFDEGSKIGLVAIRADLAELGDVRIELNPQTYLPIRLIKDRDPNSGSASTWPFGDWGSIPSVSKPSGLVPDQGPGGNPC